MRERDDDIHVYLYFSIDVNKRHCNLPTFNEVVVVVVVVMSNNRKRQKE